MGERELLLQEIQRLKSVVEESNRLQGKVDNYESKLPIFSYIDIKWKITVFLILLSIFVGLHLNSYVLVPLILVLSFIIFIRPPLYLKSYENEYNINKLKLEECKKNLSSVVIYEKYIEEYALGKLELYLISKRADTLKEAVNIFEQEKRDNQRIEEIKKLHQLQEKIYDASKLENPDN